ncbi:MAG: hypothetical protein A3F82_08220 [Deltaproteobacteria bacterium RIFCSPLOWO2_12_FULL_44_12]|nr:MAG: hypothetical protein A2712_07055 [Deltaproteobacteria bacterium RIFCSPHIGHO2_01_FULL_43_49]OGQ15705.1 MAG: hypothetical protein A3D22_05845 [Deltaproteobacteria bacterium RIFCSPHIGHO2_02_FULL_44_53]OGQ28674.1 MAG: hypothetical protein A3D98_00580 [Deltaproteobacteria bacterium RIFCSPHIGHO2_12_FULL_44_21]OGQ31996.1 MAG: hypothetical protein A2979_02785 [Deltaproteobacteria bacterium RIFCSPLOWO2_01_FULL_45_74]OGQ43610.1 MAG: hypothetical protein A3I70_03305 [Deltaproteobacteria bacterium 
MTLIKLHIFFAIFSFVFMLGAFVLGLIFLFHEKRLKSKNWVIFMSRLPPLLLNEKLALNWLRFGFFMLTAVLVTGAMLTHSWKSLLPWQILHGVLALVSWGIYAVILNRRWVGVGGKKILLLSFLGFATLTILFLWN